MNFSGWDFRTVWTLWALWALPGFPAAAQKSVDVDALNSKAWELAFTHPMEARKYSLQAKEWAEQLRYQTGLGDSYSTLGYLYCAEGAFEDGFKAYAESLRARRASGDSAKVANVFINLSIFKNIEGHYDEARADASRAIAILEGLLKKEKKGTLSYEKKAYSLGQAYLNLSNIYSDFKDNILALEYARKGFLIQQTSGNPLWIARAQKTLANRFYTAWEVKDTSRHFADSAQLYYRHSLDYFLSAKAGDEDQVSPEEIADIYYNMSQISLDQGNFKDAWQLLEQAEAIYAALEEEADRTAGLYYIWLSKGRWYHDFRHDYETALAYFRKAYRAADSELVDVSSRLELLNLFSEAFAKSGRRDSAYIYQRQAMNLSQEHFNQQQERFQNDERSDWQRQLNLEIAQSALVKERQKYLSVAVIALVLLATLILVLAWTAVRAWRQRAKAANLQIEQMVGRLDARYLEGIESEREVIAGILHDDLGGQSVANAWLIEALVEQTPPGSEQHELSTQILKSSRELSESIRTFSHRLSSVYVQRSGLIPSLQELCRDISSSGRIRARLQVKSWEGRIDVNQEIQLLRVLQELITNTVKYARAKQIAIELHGNAGYFEMYYSDDGVGFDTGAALDGSSGLGMTSIKRRVAVLGGELQMNSNPGAGMQVKIRFPASHTGPADDHSPS